MGVMNNTENTKRKIYEVLNTSNLPINVLYYIVKDIMTDVTSAYEKAIIEEQKKESDESTELQVVPVENNNFEE